MPQVKYDGAGRAYYEDSVGTKVATFVEAFLGTLNATMKMKQNKEAHDLGVIQAKIQARRDYNKLTPDEQKEFLNSYGDDVLDFMGLLEPAQEGEDKPAQAEPGKPKPAKGRTQRKVRPNAVRDWTPEELATRANARATINTAEKLADLNVKTGEAQLEAIRGNIDKGTFELKTAREDREQLIALRNSKNPFERSLGWNRPVEEFLLRDLTERYPDMTDRVMQQKFDIGPQARNAAFVKWQTEGLNTFQDPVAAKKWADAMVQAQYDGKYDALDALAPNLKTHGFKQLQATWEGLKLDRERILSSEAQSLASISAGLMKESNYALNPDTARQLAKRVMYGTPLSAGATEVYKKYEAVAEKLMKAQGEVLFADAMMKQGEMMQKTLQGARQTIDALLAQRKQGIGNKRELDKQIDQLSDKIVEIVGKDLGLDAQAIQTPMWRNAIITGVKTMYGTAGLATAAVGDKVDQETSFAGRVITDALGPQIMGYLETAANAAMEPVRNMQDAGMAIIGHDTERRTSKILELQSAADGTAIGKWVNETFSKTPGVRIMFAESLERSARDLITQLESTQNPAFADQIRERLLEIRKTLQAIQK